MDKMDNNGTFLEVKDLSVSFRSGKRVTEAVKNISFSIERGKTLALVGESGSGKSVSALSIMQLLPYPAAFHPSGSVLYEGQQLMDGGEKLLRKVRGNDISIIFQEPMTSLNPLHTIEQQIAENIELHQGLSGKETRAKVLDLLGKVGIHDAESRLDAYPHQLSGGQKQRVMIAMALANEPDLLIADEPTTALDVTIQAQILQLLMDLQEQMGMAILLITHDLGIVEKFADNVCVMQHGEIVERGVTRDIFASPKHAYTQHLLASEPRIQPPKEDDTAPVVIETTNLKVWFPIKSGVFSKVTDYVKAVDGISLKLREGQTIGVVGESGSGKTTLGLALMRLISSDGPIIYMGDKRIDGYDSKAMRPLRRKMQIVFQDPFGSLSPRMSVAEIIGEGLKIHKPDLTIKQIRDRVAASLIEVGLTEDMLDRYPHEFSGGQRQRIAVARAMILEPKFIMLDEPTSALDVTVQAQVVELLQDLQTKHKLSYLFISHDLRVVRALSNTMIIMRRGKVVEEGNAEKIFKSPETDYTKALLSAALNLEAVSDDSLR